MLSLLVRFALCSKYYLSLARGIRDVLVFGMKVTAIINEKLRIMLLNVRKVESNNYAARRLQV